MVSLVAKAQVIPRFRRAHSNFDRPTEFELVTFTHVPLLHLKQADIAIVEVGIGGRLDSTNVLLPELVICTDWL